MPLIEVEEDDFKRAKSAAQALDAVSKNPKTRAHLLSLFKTLDPNLSIPEIDVPVAIAGHVDDRTKAQEERIKKLEEQLADRDSQTEIDKTITAARRKLRKAGHSQENIQAIEALMTERGIADYDAAEALWDRTRPREEPVEPAGSNFGREWNFVRPDEGDANHQLLMKDPRGFSEKMVQQTMKELRSNRAA
jgi:hypothetical protein